MSEQDIELAVYTYINNVPPHIYNRLREEQPVNVARFIFDSAANGWEGVYENLDEVLKADDEAADRAIDRWEGKDAPEPQEKDFEWTDIIPDDDVDPEGRQSYIDPETGKFVPGHSEEEFKEALKRMGQEEEQKLPSGDEIDKNQLIGQIMALEEYIYENANREQQMEWNDFRESISTLLSLDIEQLEIVFMKASIIVNNLR